MATGIKVPETIKLAHILLGCAVAIASISTIVYASARAGVQAAVREEIEHQVAAPGSPLNRQIRAQIHEHEADVCEPRWREMRDRMRVIAERQVAAETKLDILLERTE